VSGNKKDLESWGQRNVSKITYEMDSAYDGASRQQSIEFSFKMTFIEAMEHVDQLAQLPVSKAFWDAAGFDYSFEEENVRTFGDLQRHAYVENFKEISEGHYELECGS